VGTGEIPLHFGLIGKLKGSDHFLLRVTIDEFSFAILQIESSHPSAIFAVINAAFAFRSSFH
jgi:hypothetical protein